MFFVLNRSAVGRKRLKSRIEANLNAAFFENLSGVLGERWIHFGQTPVRTLQQHNTSVFDTNIFVSRQEVVQKIFQSCHALNSGKPATAHDKREKLLPLSGTCFVFSLLQHPYGLVSQPQCVSRILEVDRVLFNPGHK